MLFNVSGPVRGPHLEVRAASAGTQGAEVGPGAEVIAGPDQGQTIAILRGGQ
jgi:hypothetical protein